MSMSCTVGMVHEMIYGYVPVEEWLLRRARRKELLHFTRKSERRVVMALEAALDDIINEAGLRGVAWLETVDVEGEPKLGIALATNLKKDRPSEDHIQRLQGPGALNTSAKPTWFYLYD